MDPKAGPRILDLRQSVEHDLFGFWNYGGWGFSVKLSASKCKGESARIKCDQPGSLSTSRSANLSFGIGGVFKFSWQSTESFDYKVEKKPNPRQYIEKLVISGKPVECPCVEAVFPFEVTAETGESLQISCLDYDFFPLRRPVKPSRLEGQITLRLCPTQNWYYVKFHYADRDVGPGWREVSSTAYRGSSESWLHLTDFDEEYLVQWEKRAMPVFRRNDELNENEIVDLVTYSWE